ncbi:MAG TPA: hypothetical protein VMS00_04845 [Acidimicrobiales bacterium]|nr:hypothetical protein [Acidimicrobiales bacterium]
MWVKRFTRQSRLVAACLLVVGGCFTTTSLGALAPSASASGGAVGLKAVGCTDPVLHDSYDGFHIGVPAGWYMSSLSGLIVVFKDYSATTEGVVQIALVNKKEPQSTFLSEVLASLSKNAKGAGNVLTFRLLSPTTAVASGHVGNVVIAGEARVSFMPTVTAHGSELGVVSAYWAPSSQLGSERAELASIGSCFGLQAGTLSRFVKDRWFGYTLPFGWTVGNEGPDELFLEAGPNASANFLLAGPFLASSTGVTDAESFQRYCFQRLGLTIKTVLASAAFPSQATAGGRTQQEIITEFLGTDGSKRVHGLVRTIASTGGGVTAGALRIALATPPLWDSLNGALIWDTYSIEHSFTEDLAAIQQQQEQLAGFSQQVAGFDQALNSTDLVEDPATGQEFEAPYTAYNQSGPDGPGYYTGSPGDETKLKIITPQ